MSPIRTVLCSAVASLLGTGLLVPAGAVTRPPTPPRVGAADATAYVESTRWLVDSLAPAALDVAPDGSVVVAMSLPSKVSRFTPTGGLIGSVSIEDVSFPYGLVVDGAGYARVTNYSDFDSAHQIVIVSPTGVVGTYGVPADRVEGFSPWGIALGPDGASYVADPVAKVVQVIAADGGYRGTIGSPGASVGQLDAPRDVAVAGDGTLYVADQGNHRVTRYRADGSLVGAWGQAGTGPGQLRDPSGVAITPGGRVLVLDGAGSAQGSLEEFSADGAFLGRTPLPIDQVGGIAVDAAGAVYVSGLLDHPNGGYGVLKMVPTSGTVPPLPGVGTVRVRGKRVDATRDRRVAAVRLACRGDVRCTGRLKLMKGKRPLARGRYAVAVGSTERARVRLTAAGKRMLRRHRSVRATLRVLPAAGARTHRVVRLVR